jgi:antitoxin HigA-1
MSKLKIAIHPGEILNEEFLRPLELSQARFAEHVGISRRAINEIVGGKRGITANTAIRFAKAFGTTPEWWLNMQMHWELTNAERVTGVRKLTMLG